jgi:cobalt ECF transporter T component CbiQ
VSEPVATPAWLLAPEPGLCPCCTIGRRRRGGFVARTLAAATSLLRSALFAEDAAAGEGLLQRLEPRAKVLAAAAVLLAVALVHHVPVLAAAYLGTVALALASRLPLAAFVRRVWLFIPVFTGLIALPATLSMVTPGPVVVSLGSWFGHPVGITSPGLRTAAVLVLRVATSVSLVVLVTLTTTWTRLLAALRGLFVPRLFVTVLAMAYRYLFHLLGSVTDMYESRRARAVHAEGGGRRGRATVAATAGALFGKAHALAEEVHLAMVARGFVGEVRTLRPTRVRARDVAVALLLALAGVAGVVVDRGL